MKKYVKLISKKGKVKTYRVLFELRDRCEIKRRCKGCPSSGIVILMCIGGQIESNCGLKYSKTTLYKGVEENTFCYTECKNQLICAFAGPPKVFSESKTHRMPNGY